MTFDELLQDLSSRLVRVSSSKPIKVAIDGIDASGKTTLADALAEYMREGGHEIVRASIDGFHRQKSERLARGALSPAGYYDDSFDYRGLEEVLLEPLSNEDPRGFRRQAFDHLNDRPVIAESETCRSGAILLFDGVFLFRPEINSWWDYRIFVDVSFETALCRAVARDASRMGGESAVEERYRNRYFPGQEIYFRRVDPRSLADVVVHNDDLAAPWITAAEIV